MDFASEVISGVRTVRKEKNIAHKDAIDISVINNEKSTDSFDEVIKKLVNASQINYVEEKIDGASFRVKSNEYFIPIAVDSINVEEEIKKITEELNYTEGFLKSVQKKLANERFVNNAPDQVVANERKKEADAVAKIETLKASLANLQ